MSVKASKGTVYSITVYGDRDTEELRDVARELEALHKVPVRIEVRSDEESKQREKA